jgi:MATE family multidrug resistance protein
MNELNHKIWRIAWPAILSNISIPLLGLVDAAILGHLDSTQYLGAVAIGGALLSFLYWGFGFLRMGTTGLVAKAMGAGNLSGANIVLGQSSVLALTLSAAVLLFHPLLLGLGFLLMSAQADITAVAESYATIRISSAPAVLLTYAIVGWFIGRQDTRWPMLIVVLTNVINIGLDFLFIVQLNMYSDGAALATVIAEYTGCSLALYGVWRNLPRTAASQFFAELKSLRSYQRLLRSNRDLFIRTLCLLFSFAFFTAMGDKQGSNILAANALMMQLVLMAAYGMDGFAFAAEALAGNKLGARDLAGFYKVVRYCSFWCAVTAICMSLFFLLFHNALFAVMTNIAPLRELLLQYTPWLILLPLVAAPSYLLDGVFIGSAETQDMMTSMLFSVFIVYIPIWFFTQHLGNHGLWFAFCVFNGARGATLYAAYLRKNRQQSWLSPT